MATASHASTQRRLEMKLCTCRRGKKYNVVFVDQVSAAIPAFLLLSRSKVCRVSPYAKSTTSIRGAARHSGRNLHRCQNLLASLSMREQGAAVPGEGGSCACTCAMPYFSLAEVAHTHKRWCAMCRCCSTATSQTCYWPRSALASAPCTVGRWMQ